LLIPCCIHALVWTESQRHSYTCFFNDYEAEKKWKSGSRKKWKSEKWKSVGGNKKSRCYDLPIVPGFTGTVLLMTLIPGKAKVLR
jgi:hypothetical protein